MATRCLVSEFLRKRKWPGKAPGKALPPEFRDYERPRKKSPADNKNDSNGSQPDTRYLTTYYPGTNDAMQASTVALKAGDEMPVNLTLVPARTYRIRGTVAGVPSSLKPSVEVFSKAGDSIRANAGEIGPDGQFEIRGVAPGSYVLKLMAHTEAVSLSAHQDVTVVAG